MLQKTALKQFAVLSADRAAALSQQLDALVRFDQHASVNLLSLSAAVLLLDQSYARALQQAIDALMRDADFPTMPLVLQNVLAEQNMLWGQLFSAVSSVAFQRRLTGFDAFVQSTPADQLTGVTRANAIAVSLESVASLTTRAGVGINDFWGLTDEARQSIARLVAADLTLGPTLDFQPFTEALHVLTAGAPLVPDVTALLARVAAVRPVVQTARRLPRVLSYIVQHGMTIEDIALKTLGDASRWRELVEFNTLRYPYVAPTRLDTTGDALGVRVLAAPTVIGQSTATFLETVDLMPDQRLRFAWNGTVQTLTIASLAEDQVTFRESFTAIFPTVAVVTVYAPVYDVVGRVLVPGDTLLVPTDAITEGAELTGLVDEPATTPARLYGVDLLVTREHLQVANGAIQTVSGLDNLKQALLHRFRVPRGTLAYHPEYGTGLHGYLGLKATPYFQFLAQVDARQTVLHDPRIASLTRIETSYDVDTLTIDLTGVTTANEQFPPLEIAVPVR